LREFLQARVRHEDVLRAVQAGLDSDDEREQLAAAKVVLGELVETGGRPEEPALAPREYDFEAIERKLMGRELLGGMVLRRLWRLASPETRAGFLQWVDDGCSEDERTPPFELVEAAEGDGDRGPTLSAGRSSAHDS
jgi:hypothetical protein